MYMTFVCRLLIHVFFVVHSKKYVVPHVVPDMDLSDMPRSWRKLLLTQHTRKKYPYMTGTGSITHHLKYWMCLTLSDSIWVRESLNNNFLVQITLSLQNGLWNVTLFQKVRVNFLSCYFTCKPCHSIYSWGSSQLKVLLFIYPLYYLECISCLKYLGDISWVIYDSSTILHPSSQIQGLVRNTVYDFFWIFQGNHMQKN